MTTKQLEKIVDDLSYQLAVVRDLRQKIDSDEDIYAGLRKLGENTKQIRMDVESLESGLLHHLTTVNRTLRLWKFDDSEGLI